MKAQDYLRQYRDTLERSKEITDHLSELKAEAERLKDHEGQSIQLDEAVAKYVDACDEAAYSLETLAQIREEITATIDKIKSEKIRTLLRYRYIHGMTWEKIAVEMNYTWRRVYQVHGDAINVIDALINP